MKKKIISRLTMVSLFMLIPYVCQADDMMEKAPQVQASKKPCQKKQKKSNSSHHNKNNNRKHEKSGKGHMHDIERKLEKILADFKSDGDVQSAKAALKKIPAEIKAAVEQMQKGEAHGSMWKRHQHKLQEEHQRISDIVDGKRNA